MQRTFKVFRRDVIIGGELREEGKLFVADWRDGMMHDACKDIEEHFQSRPELLASVPVGTPETAREFTMEIPSRSAERDQASHDRLMAAQRERIGRFEAAWEDD